MGLLKNVFKMVIAGALAVSPLIASTAYAALDIDSANWSDRRDRVTVRGSCDGRDDVTVTNAVTGAFVGRDECERGSYRVRKSYSYTSEVPCTVVAEQSGIITAPSAVNNAPANCSGPPTGGNNPPTANDDAYSTSQDTQLSVSAPGVLGNDTDPDVGDTLSVDPAYVGTGPTSLGGSVTLNSDGSFTYDPPAGTSGSDSFTYAATDGTDTSNVATVTITVTPDGGGGGNVTARGDTYATPIGKSLNVTASRVSGVLYNDFGGTGALTAVNLNTSGTQGQVSLDPDGSFSYTPPNNAIDNQVDTFTYQAQDSLGELSDPTIVSVQILSDQPDYKMTMNYELGMHCTGFEFAYCCVLPPYNSIVAQVLRSQSDSQDFPRLLEGDPNIGRDGLGRETVVRDYDKDGTFRKYQLRYYHDAQPRVEGQGKPQTSTLVSDVEGNSLLYHGTRVDSAAIGPNGELNYGLYAGAAYGVWLGDGDFLDSTDNYANAWLNHFYIYADLEGSNPNNSSQEADKIRLGVQGMVEYPKNVGAALHPMGPEGNVSGFDNVLTFSTDTGTVVYTQMKVLENLPVMLTSPRIWEALGLPLTPFEDSINFFGDPGAVDEDTVRPYVAMKASLHDYPSGNAVVGSNGQPVIGFGTAPIDIPNCERCHSAPSINAETGLPNVNSPSYKKRAGGPDPFGDPWGTGYDLEGLTDVEYQFWLAYYNINPGAGDSDWYARLKGAAINMMALHDDENGTTFTQNYPGADEQGVIAQNTRLGFESVVCQKCHADNVIAVVKSGCKVDPTATVLCPDDTGPGTRQIIQPITEAIHWNHRGTDEGGPIMFSDALGRDGGCQGCHPAHRSDGVIDGYPITLDGDNFQANSDNRLALGGCFVGRDVHSNPMKDVDGAETPEYLNAVGQWLKTNVARNQAGLAGSDADNRGIWCTNCHNQLGQELWRNENMVDLINNVPGKNADGTDAVNIRALPSLGAIANAVGVSEAQAIAWLDPTDTNPEGDFTHAIWNPDVSANPDANVATIEVSTSPSGCGPRFPFEVPRFGVYACLDFDGDPGGAVAGAGDPSVRILDFCTTPDCVAAAQAVLDAEGNGSIAAPVPFDAATDGRDHWLAPGEPHCADCHASPFTEQSGNINPYPPFNYPRKASLMRYSRGHQDMTCQGCHESIHGLYPVTPTIDSTSYAQAASLNPDGSHGPLKCATCHDVNADGVPSIICPPGSSSGKCDGNGQGILYQGVSIHNDYDRAVAWMHTYTDEADPTVSVCLNCHNDKVDEIFDVHTQDGNEDWLEHADKERVARSTMDKVEIGIFGYVVGDPDFRDPYTTVCTGCHSDRQDRVDCSKDKWRQHLTQGRVAEKVWEFVSEDKTGTTCGW